MEEFFEDYETLGLPGGPNELKRFTNGFIISERGQWDYPGQPTAVPTPSGQITMQGVEDDLVGIDNLGNMQYMTPGNDYQFEGDMVYEIPQAKRGGSKKPSKKYSRSLMAKNRLFAKNPLFEKRKSVKNKIFDPYSPYFQNGGSNITKLSKEEEKAFQKFYATLPDNLQTDDDTYDIRGYWDSEGRPNEFNYDQPKEDDGYYHAYSINSNTGEYLKSPAHETFQHAIDEDRRMGWRPITNVYGRNIAIENPDIAQQEHSQEPKGYIENINYNSLPINYADALKNFVYPEVVDSSEETGYDAALGVIKQNPNDPIANVNNPWWYEHELLHHLQNQAGGMSTYGAVGLRPNPYVASDEAIGSYYDRRGSEFQTELNRILKENPDISEEEAYTRAEEDLYNNPTTTEGEARNYEGYIEAGNPSIFPKKQKGGYIETELTPEEIAEYRKGGYVVEDISVPSLTKASYGYSVGNLIRKDDGGSVSGTQGLTADFSQRLTQMILDARSQGIDLGVGSGYRSYEKQKRLWEQALKKYGSPEKARKWVAPPGGSFHNKGLAVDLNANGQFLGKDANSKATEWAHANAKKYGLHFRMGHEPWHIEPIEKTKSSSDKEKEHDHMHADTYGDTPQGTADEQLAQTLKAKELELQQKQRLLAEQEEAMHDDDYSNWTPAKKQAVVDPREQQLEALANIMATSNQNLFQQYNANLQGQMQMGGFIAELDEDEIERYRKGGYIIEEID